MLWIIKFFGFMFLFMVCYDKLTRKYINPYKTYLYYGKKGCGKTTLLTKIAIKSLLLRKIVYSSVAIPGTRLFDPKKLDEFTFEFGSVILIDEIGLIWDNRQFKTFKAEINEWFKYARQYGCEVHMFSQVPDIDLKIRNLCDAYYLVENKLRVFSYAKRISKVLTVRTDIEGKGNLVDSFEFVSFFSPKSRILTFIPRWSAFYQSFNPPEREYIPYKELPLNDNQMLAMDNYFKWFIKNFNFKKKGK